MSINRAVNNRAVKWLFRPENRFFTYLESISALVCGATEIFDSFRAAKSREQFRQIADSMRLKEQETDELAHTLYDEVDKSYGFTPLDREDMHALARALDDILDAMDSASERIYLFKLLALTEPMLELVRIQCEAVREVAHCVRQLRDLRHIEEIRVHMIHVHSLENEGDKLYRKSLEALFDNISDPIELLRQKEVLDALEDGIDSCENAVHVIRSVAVKNG